VASVASSPDGRRRIIFTDPRGGKRKTLRLGLVAGRDAESVRVHVERLVAAALTQGPPPDETSRWIAALPDLLRKRLEAVGLITPVTREAGPMLKTFLDGYLAGRTDLQESSRVSLTQACGYLVDFFGADKPLRDIRPGDADEWAISLADRGLADATIRRRSGQAKQVFKNAVRKGLLAVSPFSDLKSANVANPARQAYIPRDVAQKVLDACPDAEWRLIFALCRFAGLRCPSEIVPLRWQDVLWDKNRMIVHSPKTACHPGQETRQVPLFPEVAAALREAFDAAEPGSEFCIMRYRKGNGNLSTQLRRILWKAGVDPWPRLFQNLRASCDTDLAARFPAHVCARWLGHTPQIAAKHYLQVRDSDFEAAAGERAALGARAAFSGGSEAARIPARAVQFRTVQDGSEKDEKPENPLKVEIFEDLDKYEMGDTGLEPVTSCVSSRRSSHLS